MPVTGLDIGGANLKAADLEGRAVVRPFALWKEPDHLPERLRELLAEFPPAGLLAVTMTAELADCFSTKADGVDFVLRSVAAAAGDTPIVVWQTGAEFVSPGVAREIPLLVAAANWHALATWAGRMAPCGAALLIDVGSTTTDIVPLIDGVPVPHGLTDGERLMSGELAYSGVRRTPLCAVAHSVPLREGYCPLAAEVFSTMLDVYLLLGQIPENPADCDTANRRPATREAAWDRLVRNLCCDRTELALDEAESTARFLADVQRQRLAGAATRVLARAEQPVSQVLISGTGSFLADLVVRSVDRLRDAAVQSLSDTLGPELSAAACALAVARLAAERQQAP